MTYVSVKVKAMPNKLIEAMLRPYSVVKSLTECACRFSRHPPTNNGLRPTADTLPVMFQELEQGIRQR